MAYHRMSHSTKSHGLRPPAVAMYAVSHHFDDIVSVPALVKIDLAVEQGEIFGVVGPLGAGKSTLLRILAGQLAPSEGKVRVLGRPPSRRAIHNRIGYLPESPAHIQRGFYSRLTELARDMLFGKRRPTALVPERIAS